jgi:mono/diheme cytochrome c family protein
MRFRGLLLVMTAVFTLTLLSTLTVPQSALAVAAVQSGSGDNDNDEACPAPGEMRRDNSGPGSAEDGNAIEGRRIYMRENCYICHGGFAGGGMCPSLREPRPGDDKVREVVQNGTENGMPPFPHLTEVDIQNLCAYMQSLRTRCEPTFTHWWEPVPTQ